MVKCVGTVLGNTLAQERFLRCLKRTPVMVNLHHLKVHRGKICSNSTRKHFSSGEVPKVLQKDTRPMKSSTVRRYSSTSDGQSAPSKGPHGKMRRNNARKTF